MRLLFAFLLISSFAVAQQNAQQIAYQYYINGEYEKAIVLYEDLMEKRFSVAYFSPYFQSLISLEEYKLAELLARKVARKYPNNLNYQLQVGVAQLKAGDTKKSERTFKKVTSKVDGNRSQAISLANTFNRYSLFEKSLNIYLLAEKLNPKNNFGNQKGQLYGQLGKSDLMISEYLLELSLDPRKKQQVLNKIQKFLDNDGIKSEKNYQLVKKQLLPLVRLEKERTDFAEMLIWLFMQNHQFKMALRQAKALDKRQNSDGEEVYDLGDSFLDKEYFDLSIEAYDYVISKGKQNYLYIDANINRLYALSKKINNDKSNLTELDTYYQSLIEDLGSNRETVILLSNYAHFQAFYNHDLVKAEALLIDAMKISGIEEYDLAECKLEYADVQLLLGNVWESLLYYSQVEKDFKEHPLGHEAKLRRAKISYYQGDFQWAQAQLATLKASTSKLIANDAMELSLLITDNYNLDTTEVAMRAFALGDLLVYQQKYDEAIIKYDSVLIAFPGNNLTDEIYLRKSEIYYLQNKYNKALSELERIEEDWAYDILADDALYKRAKIYENILDDMNNAMLLYEKIILEHNSSIFVAESRKRFRELRGDNLKVEE